MTTTTHEAHHITGLPIEHYPTFEVGDLVSEHINSDAYPAVVVAVAAKTVWVSSVQYQIGNVSPTDIPGWNGYGDSASLVVDPESVKAAVAAGKTGAKSYRLRVAPKPTNSFSMREAGKYGDKGFHRTSWRRHQSFYLSKGATYRQDPHV